MATPDICPECGAEVPARARACPECGADESTGWSDRATSQRLGVMDDEENTYDDIVENEFSPPRERRLPIVWVVTAALLLAALFAWLVPYLIR